MVLYVNPYYGATLFFDVGPPFHVSCRPVLVDTNILTYVNPRYGVSPFYGVSPSDGVGC